MRNKLKWLAVALGGIVGGGLPLTVAFLAWSWVMDQVPRSSEWAGLIKIGISFLMLVCGGWITVLCAFALGGMLGALVLAAVDPE